MKNKNNDCDMEGSHERMEPFFGMILFVLFMSQDKQLKISLTDLKKEI